MTHDEFSQHLIDHDHQLTIACDTEFQYSLTLTIQFAVRLGDMVVVQLYHDPSIRVPNPGTRIDLFRSTFNLPCAKIIARKPRPISADLSPSRMLADLFGIAGVTPVARRQATGGALSSDVPPIHLKLVAHYWPADFFRIFGSHFNRELLLGPKGGLPAVGLGDGKLMKYVEAGPGASRYRSPIVEIMRTGTVERPIKLSTFDTSQAFGSGSLDDLAKTFLGVGKPDLITPAEKAEMKTTFLKKPGIAAEYACLDAILTLLVHERMIGENREIYRRLGLEGETAPFRPTPGGRIVDIMTRQMAANATGSVRLSKTGKLSKDGRAGPVSVEKTKELMARGSVEYLANNARSRFGSQIGLVHGGLSFSRSPDRLVHKAPGMLYDVDLSGCYNAITSNMRLYAGRPVLVEPGSARMTLAEAVTEVEKHAVGRDGWIIYVSGPVTSWDNALIPSTCDAMTTADVGRRRSARKADSRPHDPDSGRTSIRTAEIRWGVVSWATWEVIQALPAAVRREYESLRVDAFLMYPSSLVARNGEEYDRLVAEHEQSEAPWSSRLCMEKFMVKTTEFIDSRHVSLEFDLGSMAACIGRLRAEARTDYGKGSGRELMLKSLANNLYGVTASKYFHTHNVVAANVITSTARAQAFMMFLALNGIQVITDGCSYVRNQIPSGTLRSCLTASADYPIRRPDEVIKPVDPASVPGDDGEFTDWLRRRITRFFEASRPGFQDLLGLFRFEHKRSGPGKSPAFDGLCCDGGSNYIKLSNHGRKWRQLDFKARSFDSKSKAGIVGWLANTALQDRYRGPSPITESVSLMTCDQAMLAVRQAGESMTISGEQPGLAIVPLGFPKSTVRVYKVIKASAFLCRTEAQEKKIRKSMDLFENRHHAGLELAALRRKNGGDQPGSVTVILGKLYRYIRSGKSNLTKKFYLSRFNRAFGLVLATHVKSVDERKRQLEQELMAGVILANSPRQQMTGLIVTPEELRNIHRLRAMSRLIS